MNPKSKMSIRFANIPEDLDLIKQLWLDYLTWGNNNMQANYGVHPHNPVEIVEKDLEQLEIFQAPFGCIILAICENKICGIGNLSRINGEIGELKRIYVNPDFRRFGAGRAILESLLTTAKNVGYKSIRLNTPKFMEAAHALYRSVGFCDIEHYAETEIPESFKDYLLFMELDLADFQK